MQCGLMIFVERAGRPAQLEHHAHRARFISSRRANETPPDVGRQGANQIGMLREQFSSQVFIAQFDGLRQAQIERAAERHAPGMHMRLPSAAGHDAAVLSYRMPAGMMFIPSLGGISHHWSEDTREDDIVLGAQIFADAALGILRAAR